MEFIDVSAKTIEDAIAKGVAQLAAEGQDVYKRQECTPYEWVPAVALS